MASSIVAVLVWIVNILISIDAKYTYYPNSWTIGNTTLPRPSSHFAIGYDNFSETVWIIGGRSPSRQQLIAFKAQNNNYTFIDFGNSTLAQDVYNVVQYYTQIGDYLYLIHYAGSGLDRFHLPSQTIQYAFTAIPTIVDLWGCITSFNIDQGYIISIGGNNYGTYLNKVQIFNISSGTWLSAIPSLQTQRRAHSCISYNNKVLYAIGGTKNSNSDKTDTIEVLNVPLLSNISAMKWEFTQNPLSIPMCCTKTIVYKSEIVVFGGVDGSGTVFDYIHIIDTSTNYVTAVRGSMDIAITAFAPIVIQDRIFVFGGRNNSLHYLNEWRFIDPQTFAPTVSPTLLTSNPSYSPSNNPTNIPSINPTTQNPTVYPSDLPTMDPTYMPTSKTIIPTYFPSVFPTQATNNPTEIPTNDPTEMPTNIPSEYPTMDPTYMPTPNTNIPTYFPSVFPTEATSNPTEMPTMDPTYNPIVKTDLPSVTPIYITEIPSEYPTMDPTYNPIVPTYITEIPTDNPITEYPTYIPTEQPILYESTQSEDEFGLPPAPGIDIGSDALTMIVYGGIIACACMWIMIFYVKKKKKKKNNFAENNLETQIEMTDTQIKYDDNINTDNVTNLESNQIECIERKCSDDIQQIDYENSKTSSDDAQVAYNDRIENKNNEIENEGNDVEIEKEKDNVAETNDVIFFKANRKWDQSDGEEESESDIDFEC